jgi:hypothetical protein
LNSPVKYIPNQSIEINENPIYEELFDILKDPKEQNNLVGNAKYSKVLNEYRKKCKMLVSELN